MGHERGLLAMKITMGVIAEMVFPRQNVSIAMLAAGAYDEFIDGYRKAKYRVTDATRMRRDAFEGRVL
jgi:hypothetical protein